MCACGCLVLIVIAAVIVFAVMHGLWLMLAAVLLVAAVLGWMGKRMMDARKAQK